MHRVVPLWPDLPWRWLPIAVAVLVIAVILALLEFIVTLPEPVFT
jgi:hypothetical protein